MPHFKYISHRCLADSRVLNLSLGECSICNNVKPNVFYLWQWPTVLYICLDCVENESSADRKIALRHFMGFADQSISADQFYELVYRTPPTPTFSAYIAEEVGWPRHCNDFCQFDGDLSISEICDSEIRSFADEQGVDASDVVECLEMGDIVVHKFKCLTCSHEEMRFDFDY